jgi:hypothetical protein
MAFASAENTVVNAALAQVKIAIIAGTAVVMSIRDCSTAVVAVD